MNNIIKTFIRTLKDNPDDVVEAVVWTQFRTHSTDRQVRDALLEALAGIPDQSEQARHLAEAVKNNEAQRHIA